MTAPTGSAPESGPPSGPPSGVAGTSLSPDTSDDVPTPVPVVPGSPASDDGSAERGRLDIALGVVRKIAERAADLTEGTTTVRRRVAGVGLGESGSTAKVSGYGDQVDLRLELPLAYPAPITVTVDAVRGNVRERVEELTGYRVRSVDVTVSALTAPTPGPSRTGRTE